MDIYNRLIRLSWDELTSTLRPAIQSRRAVGLEVTIHNPARDTGRTGARELVRIMGDVLA